MSPAIRLLWLVLLPWPLLGQGTPLSPTDAEHTKTRGGLTNLSVPEMPAFSFLGKAPTGIARPNGARALGAALLQGVDGDGKVQQGFAFEVMPVLQLGDVSLTAYRSSFWSRLASNLQVSLATARSSGDGGATTVGVGLRATLLDRGDPLLDAALVRRIDSLVDGCAPQDFNATNVAERVKACMADKLKESADEWNRRQWNATSWVVAAALGTELVGSRIQDRRSLGWRAWTTLGLKVQNWGQLMLHGAFEDNRAVADSIYNAATVGVRMLVGSASVNGFAEVLGQWRSDLSPGVADNGARWSGGIEFTLAKDLWLSTGFGSDFERVKSPDQVLVFANVKWGISEKGRLGPR